MGRKPKRPFSSSTPSYSALLDEPCLSSGYFQSLPAELLWLFFAWIHPSIVLKYRRLSTRFDNLLMHPSFARLNIDRFSQTTGFNEGTLNYMLYDSIDIWANRTGTYFDHLLSVATKIRWGKPFARSCLIPNQLGKATLLTYLKLNVGCLHGRLPSSLFQLTRLEYMILNDNNLNGPIPAEIGLLSKLVQLDLSYNRFTGVIPVELGNLSMLKTLSLSHNRLRGNLPRELGNLKSLTDLYVHFNRLCGSIPETIGNLKMLHFMHCESNLLSGNVPKSMFQLERVQLIDLRNNPELVCEFIEVHPGFPLNM